MSKPLQGLRVIELGQLLAGPFAGCMLGYFGAEVIKIEPPGGDPIRNWREVKDGTSLWWRSLGRNKKCISLDLKTAEGRDIVRQLMKTADIVVENFRPGVLEAWNLDPVSLQEDNPNLIYARISGYGQTGPYAEKPGFASACEAISGFRFVNGYPGEAPVRPNLSIGDTVSGLHAVIGILMALRAKDQAVEQGISGGQVVDVALYESMFNLLEAVIPEYDGAGVVRQPSGTTVTGIVPTNTYKCADGKFLVIGGNGDSIFVRLMQAVGRADMAGDEKYSTNANRVTHEQEIDKVLASWCSSLPLAEAMSILEASRVPCGPVYSAVEMMADEHFNYRELFEQVEINGEPLKLPAMMPKLAGTPGGTEWPGPEIASHTDEILEGLGMDSATITHLKSLGVVADSV
ncbi:MAG: CoA transferase [Porticoccaceae bacterium]|jgi:crotonobetainyl-CoA:carnitine CoA-transferase CaiB-like acyl-CoA transferase|nr:CoA transferase [Porticoccaceae bacterium]MDB9733379.1 CoA transferase [Porticoccaceae bacterium]